MEEQTYYRYEGSHGSISLVECKFIKETKCGFWVDYFGQKKIIYNGATKQFAHPTKEAALKSFKSRKFKQRRILKAKLEMIEAIILMLDNPERMEYLNKWGHVTSGVLISTSLGS